MITKRVHSGRVRNRTLAEAVLHILGNAVVEDGCLVGTVRRKDGYCHLHFEGKLWLAHRVVARYYMGKCPEGQEVRHLCGRGNKGCVTPSHLAYGTRLENTADMYRHGTVPRGERSGRARFTEAQVREIRTRHAQGGVSCAELAREYGFSEGSVRKVLKRIRWRHVE